MRIGIMGLGRIGRNLLRILHRSDEIEIAAISDVADPEALAYLIRFDTLLGRFPAPVALEDGYLRVADRRIRMLAGENPEDAKWGDLGVEAVVEATSRQRTRAELDGHLDAGARRVLLCAPPIDPPDLTVVIGVNDHLLRREHRIVSNASCTAHAAAPVAKILHQAFGIERAFLTSVHAYTNQQRLADVPAEDMRRGRAAAENIIPQETNAAAMLMELLPELDGRVTGLAINVPIPNGSVVDLVSWHSRQVSAESINDAVRAAAASDAWRGILGFEDEPIVSSDVLHSIYSGTFDAQATMVIGGKVSKTLSWFDNGWGYAHRAVDLLRRFSELDREAAA